MFMFLFLSLSIVSAGWFSDLFGKITGRSVSSSEVSPVYRFWNQQTGSHFYTISETEKNSLINDYSHVFVFEDAVFYAFASKASNTLPVYRFWNQQTGSHFYTISETEKNSLINDYSHVFVFEDAVFYAFASKIEKKKGGQLVSYWNFDGNTNDLVGKNHGNANNIKLTEGVMKQAYEFNGRSSSIDIPYSSTLDINALEGLTYSLWIKIYSLPASGKQAPIIGLYGINSTKNYLHIGKNTVGYNLTFDQYPASRGWISILPPSLNEWHHVGVTQNSTASVVYLNGKIAAYSNTPEKYFGQQIDTIRIGRGAHHWENDYFNGTIDEIKIWNYSLTEEEIVEEYNRIKNRVYSCIKCPDFNNDGVINETDQVSFTDCVYFGRNCDLYDFDLNGDGAVSISGDLPCIVKFLGVKTNNADACVSRINMTVATIKNAYSMGELVELTDPPLEEEELKYELKSKDGIYSNIYEDSKYLFYRVVSKKEKVGAFRVDSLKGKLSLDPKIFLNNETKKIKLDEEVSHISFTGDIIISEDNGYLRLISKNKEGNKSLIFSTESLIFKKGRYRFDDICQETCVYNLNSVDEIIIESKNARLYLKKLNFAKELPSVNFEELKKNQDREIISRLNERNKKENLNWVAGETGISDLSYEEKVSMFGGDLPDLQGFEYYADGVFEIKDKEISQNLITGKTILETKTTLMPESFSWTNAHGSNWMTSVKDQGSTGNCWAHASLGSVEALINLYFNTKLNIDLAEGEPTSNCCSECGGTKGGYPEKALEYVKKTGVLEELVWRTNLLNSKRCSISPENKWFIQDYSSFSFAITEKDLDHVKIKLIQEGPMAITVASWNHVMVLVGYRINANGETEWHIKNSWGTKWGQKGYVWLKHNEDEFWIYQPLSPISAPANFNHQIKCEDKDGDGYCNWGISKTKPQNCPETCKDLKDFDDSNPEIGAIEVKINSCLFVINSPGYYTIDESIRLPRGITHAPYCILINSSDVILDCKGNKIRGTGNVVFGIDIKDGSNVQIRNCNINARGGVSISKKSNDNVLERLSVNAISFGGRNSVGFNVEGNNNLVYNNYVIADNPLVVGTGSKNLMNVDYVSGQNILKTRNYVAGNYWGNLEGTGFSDRCFSSKINGVCDEVYKVNDNNIDFFPVSRQFCGDGVMQEGEECEAGVSGCDRGGVCEMCKCIPIKSQIISLEDKQVYGLLKIKVQKFEEGRWKDVKDVVRETLVIKPNIAIGLDIIWAEMGYWKSSEPGRYRIFSELRKLNKEIYRDYEGNPLIAIYEFDVF
jgi:hypothetical protein